MTALGMRKKIQSKKPKIPGGPDEEGGRQRVGRPGPHRLVGGMADVGRRLDHPAEQPAEDRGQALRPR